MKTGYVIAKNSLAKEFFTASSAYDRARWIPVTEATTYATAALADSAVKKLLRNGEYQCRVVALSEMNLDMAPISPMGVQGQRGQDEELPPEDGMDDADPMASDDEFSADDEGSDDEDPMTADEEGEVCPDCEHEPCTCEDKDGDDDELSDLVGDFVDDVSDLDSEPGADDDEFSDDEFDDEDSLGDDLEGQTGHRSDDELEQEADPRFDQRRMGMVQLSPMGGPRMESNDFADDPESKVTVPSNVKSELASTIAKFTKEADMNKGDEARASFCLTVVDALTQLKDELNKGTVASLKTANQRMTSFMNPITTNIPAVVSKFILSGGKKSTLKELFDAKRTQR